MKTVGTLLLALALLAPSPAFAKRICVRDDGDSIWLFPKVKKLKPGQAIALSGVFLPNSAPVTGTAYMDFTGAVRIGVFVHSMAPFSNSNSFAVNILGDTDFAGAGNHDSDGDNVGEGPSTWTALDCAEALNPTSRR
jgi:hypothetical protein